MTHVSLFTGIGGIDLAGEWAGFETIAQVERDPYCLKILKRHWPNVHRCTEIRDFPDQDYGAVTLVSGGFPCQPFSAAGKRRGKGDDRYLWPEMLRVIQQIKPSWVLAENVPGILSLEQGLLFEHLLDDLEASGYEVGPPLLIPASGVGANHRRERVFVVAHSESERSRRRPEEVRRSHGRQNGEMCGEFVGTSKDVAKSNGSGSRGEVRDLRNEERGTGEDRRKSIQGRRRWETDFAECNTRPASQDVEHSQGQRGRKESDQGGFVGASQDVADTVRERWQQGTDDREFVEESKDIPHDDGEIGQDIQRRRTHEGLDRWRQPCTSDWWNVEPDVGRVATRVPHRVDRLRALGNAVVPQQVYPILKAIAEVGRAL